jgi:lysozyme
MNRKALTGIAAAAIAIAGGLVHHFEGTRYVAYQDGVGRWTLCDGHTAGVKQGDTATPQLCAAWREEDLRIAGDAIDRCIHTTLTANARAALLDATYNLGPSVVCGSTLQRKANAGEPFCRELLRWDHAGGTRVAGLTRRRQAEATLCETP